jgi:hypothetical protein
MLRTHLTGRDDGSGWLRREVVDVGDDRFQGGFEGDGAALGLSQEQAALHGGAQCKGKLARVGAGWQGGVRPYRRGDAAWLSDDVRSVTGAAPRPLRAFIADHVTAFT